MRCLTLDVRNVMQPTLLFMYWSVLYVVFSAYPPTSMKKKSNKLTCYKPIKGLLPLYLKIHCYNCKLFKKCLEILNSQNKRLVYKCMKHLAYRIEWVTLTFWELGYWRFFIKGCYFNSVHMICISIIIITLKSLWAKIRIYFGNSFLRLGL